MLLREEAGGRRETVTARGGGTRGSYKRRTRQAAWRLSAQSGVSGSASSLRRRMGTGEIRIDRFTGVT
jgi:hypothetical protein